MDFARQLVKTKLVPLGFDEDELNSLLYVKIKAKNITIKKELYVYLSNYILKHSNDLVLKFKESYREFYYKIKSQKEGLLFPPREDQFYFFLFYEYLKEKTIDINMVKYHFNQAVKKQNSLLGFLKRKYSKNVSELLSILNCLSDDEKTKVRSYYDAKKTLEIEKKVSYGFKLLILSKLLQDSTLNLSSILASPNLETQYLNYFKNYFFHTEYPFSTLKTAYQQENHLETKKVLSYFFEDAFFDGEYEVSFVQQLISKWISQIPIFKNRIEGTNNIKSLYSKFPTYPKELIDEIVQYFKIYYPRYYHILVLRHGESFLEWNSLHEEDTSLYNSAIAKIQNTLLKYERGLTIKEIFEPKKIVSSKSSKDKKKPVNQPKNLDDYGDKKTIEKLLIYFKKKYPKYYDVILFRFGENLDEFHSISKIQENAYKRAMKKLQILIAKRSLLQLAKQTIKTHPDWLGIIRDIKKGMNTQKIKEKYHMTIEDVFQFYQNTFSLYNVESFTRIMKEFFLYGYEERLLNDSTYWLVLQTVLNDTLRNRARRFANDLEQDGKKIENLELFLKRK